MRFSDALTPCPSPKGEGSNMQKSSFDLQTLSSTGITFIYCTEIDIAGKESLDHRVILQRQEKAAPC
jgi:hypothetical protein